MKSKILEDLRQARKHLEYSFNKVKQMNALELSDNDEEALETLESFSSRFARFSDIAVTKYFRFLAQEQDPAFRGSVIDLINMAEKYGWIKSALIWRNIRELRNAAAHEYSAADYKKIYKELIRLCPELLSLEIKKA
jgi:hypothetical protein